MNHQQTLKEIKEAVRAHYAFPGGYEMHLVMNDGESMCMKCARKEWRSIYRETKHWIGGDRQWQTIGADVYWEGPPMECCHCGEPLESAYGDPWAEEEQADEINKPR